MPESSSNKLRYGIVQGPQDPYTLALVGCIPKSDSAAEKRLLPTIPGSIPRLDELPAGCVFTPRCGFVEPACRMARPPLVDCSEGRVGHTHLTACRRWRVVPAPAEYLLHAAHALPDTADEGSPPRTIAAVDDVSVAFRLADVREPRRRWISEGC